MASATWDWEGRIGSRIRLRDLHVLSAVVRWGSMAKAASHLAMSQSAVSESIATLESALGVRLLDRSPQGVAPTIYAEALLKRGHVVFDELRQGVKDIEFLADPTKGEVRVACPELLSGRASACHNRPIVPSAPQDRRPRRPNGHDEPGVSRAAGAQGRSRAC